MIHSKQIVKNSRAGKEQWDEVVYARRAYAANEAMHSQILQQAGFKVNEGLIPQDVYREFDNVTVEIMHLDDGDTYMNDLLPLSRSINIGKLVQQFRRASSAGNSQTSMTGQIGVLMDQTEFSYDGAIVPIHDNGFFRNWREWNAQSSEGFDALIDDQRETMRDLREHVADSFMDGTRDKDGNLIVVDAISWGGMRNDSRVAQIQLGAAGVNFDFTLSTNSFTDIEAAFKEVRDIMWLTNKCSLDCVYYVSNEIASNFERASSESYNSQKILQRLAGLQKVRELKATNKLTGNQMMMFPLDASKIRPIVGMGMNTVAMPRPVYNSNYQFVNWGAIGWEVRTDYDGNTCAGYASVF